MKNHPKRLSRLAAMLASSCLLLTSCEEPNQDSDPEPVYNRGYGRDNFSVSPGLGQTNDRGASSEKVVDVYPFTAYDVLLECTNDGDSDRVAITIDGKKVGEYVTDENRMNGYGWYYPQYAGPYSVVSTGATMALGVKVLSTDSWGVWPKEWTVTKK